MKLKKILVLLLGVNLVFSLIHLPVFANEINDLKTQGSVSVNSDLEGEECIDDLCDKDDVFGEDEANTELYIEAAETLASVIVNDANSYVGVLPYKSGGTSLTTGADCSGFVCAIFAKYGYNLWGYRTKLETLPSSIAQNIGTNINNALPGDIIVFSGHVGIYAGNKLLINAANSTQGTVKKNYSYYGTVVAIMRVNGVVQSLSKDTASPQIKDVQVVDVTNSGYTVKCTVTDNVGIGKVQFPTWTDKNGQDDIAWKEGNQFGTNTSQNVTFKVNTSEHNNEGDWYNTHIYAWDTSGNSTNTGVRVFIDKTPPQITNIQVTNIGLDGYTVSCIVTDNCGVARVQFPSWTTYNDQDDITPTWWTNAVATGSRSGNVFSYYVSRDSHNQEVLGYMTHIYAYDEAGNYTYASAVNQLSLIGIAQDIGDEFQSAIQNVKTGKYLTQEDSGNVASYENMNLDAQKWKFKQLSDGSYQILSLKNDYSLDCWGAAENETNIASSPYHGRDNQRWYLYGNEKDGYYIMPKNSVSCGVSLNYASSENGTNAKMYNIYASSDQRFYIKGSKNITPVEDKKTAENKNSLKDENPETDKQPTKNDSSVGDEGITNITQNNSTATFISRMYTVALGRTAEQSGLNSWTQKLSDKEIDGAGIANGFINSAEFKNRNLNNSDYLDVLYRTFFDREADAVGKSYWMDKLQKGTSRTEVLSGFVNSQEFSGLCDRFDIARGTMQTNGTSIYRPGVRSYVLRMYTKALNRDGETVGVEDWTNRINTRVMSPEAVAKSFFSSQEFINRKLNNADYVETLYQTFMDRASDVKGKQYWIDKLNGGTSRQQVLEGFSRSEEFSKIMKRYGL